jgi:type II secretion system protein J
MQIKADEGYSLLELLVAVAIMAMAAVPLTDGLLTGLRTWERTNIEVSEVERIVLARQRLRHWFSRSYLADVKRGGVEEAVYSFDGQQESVSFLTAISPDTRSDELYKVLISLAESGELLATISADHEQDVEGLTAVILSGVKKVDFLFLDHAVPGQWEAVWVNQKDLPKAIRLRLEFSDNQMIWPDLVVPFYVNEWAHCGFDNTLETCLSGVNAQ